MGAWEKAQQDEEGSQCYLWHLQDSIDGVENIPYPKNTGLPQHNQVWDKCEPVVPQYAVARISSLERLVASPLTR